MSKPSVASQRRKRKIAPFVIVERVEPKHVPIAPGTRFGQLVVVGGRPGATLTKCDCGAERTVRAQKLRNGNVTACADCTNKAAKERGDQAISAGTRFGKLVVENGLTAAVRCRCDCGATDVVVARHTLRKGNRTSCGCHRNSITVGQRFGRLEVVDLDGGEQRRGRPRIDGNKDRSRVVVRCDCGTTKAVLRAQLRDAGLQSCGCLRSRKMEAPGVVPVRALTRIRHGAESRGLEVAITLEFITDLFELQGRCCALTGWPIGFDDRTASLDRIDSDQGYLPHNVQWTHAAINVMKLDHPTDAFVAMCRAVAKHADRPKRRGGIGPGQLRLLASP